MPLVALPRPIARGLYRATLLGLGERELEPRLRWLQARQWDSANSLTDYQGAALRQMLQYARTNCEFYRDHIPDLSSDGREPFAVLSDLPLLQKSDLQLHFDKICSEKQPKRVARKTTGGSTGEPVSVLKGRQATAYERAAMWLAYGWFGVTIGDRAARFWGSPFTFKRRLTSAISDFCMNRIRFSAFEFDDEDLRTYWDKLDSFEPDYVHGYVSMLEQMARFKLVQGVDVDLQHLKSVVATSEVLTEPQRTVIERAFEAPVQVEYGCGEVGPIAHECPQGRLHIMSPNLYVEILRPDGTPASAGESGEVVLTDLHNRAMPLIRYRVGDYGLRGVAETCECGRGLPVLDKVWGRAYDFVESPNGRRYHGEFFMYVFEDLRTHGMEIGQFQVLQEDPSGLRVLVASASRLEPEARQLISETITDRIPGMRVRVESVSEIPREPSGKMRVIKQAQAR